MFSLSKILFLILVIGAVWFGWRWYNRIQAVGRERLRERERRGEAPTARRPSAGIFSGTRQDAARQDAAEDMEKCPECGAYVAPRSAVSCGRPACPYGR